MAGQCCGCCTYRTGTLVLGVLSEISGALNLIAGGTYISQTFMVHPAYGYVSLIAGIIAVLAGILLLIGVFKNKRNLLVPYCVLILANAAALMGIAIYAFVEGEYGTGFSFLFAGALDMYFAYAVLTYRKILALQNAQTQMRSQYPAVPVVIGTAANPPAYQVTAFQTGSQQQGFYPQQPQFGSYPQQPQFGSYPQQPQFGSYPQQPQFGSYPQQPQFGSYPQQPQFGSYPQQPQFGSYPQQPPFGAPSSQPQNQGQVNPNFGTPTSP